MREGGRERRKEGGGRERRKEGGREWGGRENR